MNAKMAQVPGFLTWESESEFLLEILPHDFSRQIHIDAIGDVAAPPPIHQALLYAGNEAEKLVLTLQRNISKVGVVSQSAQGLISQVLSTILLRKFEEKRSFSSSSWPSRPGVIGIINSEQVEPNGFLLMDTLVHEATHSLLYAIEKSEPFYISSDAPLSFKAHSPWTGRELFLHSYVHACFVWFGLWSFWRRARLAHCFDDPAADFFEKRARKGFTPNLLSALGEGEGFISGNVQNAVGAMEDIVAASS